MRTDSTRRHLKLFGNLLFIAIALTLFILNLIRYASVYLKRKDYQIIDRTLIIPIETNITTIVDCSSSNYSTSIALTIYQWFIDGETTKNKLFHVFFWWMMIFSLIVSVLPSLFYIIRYFQSNQYNITERFWLSRVNHLFRTFFSTTIFILPSFYMYTFDFDDENFCLKTYPLNFVIEIFPFVLATMIGLTLYFLMNGIIDQFYTKHRFCCHSEWISYGGLCCLTLLMIGILLFSTTILFYIWIISFIEKPLRLAAILVIVQMPFLPVQLLID